MLKEPFGEYARPILGASDTHLSYQPSEASYAHFSAAPLLPSHARHMLEQMDIDTATGWQRLGGRLCEQWSVLTRALLQLAGPADEDEDACPSFVDCQVEAGECGMLVQQSRSGPT